MQSGRVATASASRPHSAMSSHLQRLVADRVQLDKQGTKRAGTARNARAIAQALRGDFAPRRSNNLQQAAPGVLPGMLPGVRPASFEALLEDTELLSASVDACQAISAAMATSHEESGELLDEQRQPESSSRSKARRVHAMHALRTGVPAVSASLLGMQASLAKQLSTAGQPDLALIVARFARITAQLLAAEQRYGVLPRDTEQAELVMAAMERDAAATLSWRDAVQSTGRAAPPQPGSTPRLSQGTNSDIELSTPRSVQASIEAKWESAGQMDPDVVAATRRGTPRPATPSQAMPALGLTSASSEDSIVLSLTRSPMLPGVTGQALDASPAAGPARNRHSQHQGARLAATSSELWQALQQCSTDRDKSLPEWQRATQEHLTLAQRLRRAAKVVGKVATLPWSSMAGMNSPNSARHPGASPVRKILQAQTAFGAATGGLAAAGGQPGTPVAAPTQGSSSPRGTGGPSAGPPPREAAAPFFLAAKSPAARNALHPAVGAALLYDAIKPETGLRPGITGGQPTAVPVDLVDDSQPGAAAQASPGARSLLMRQTQAAAAYKVPSNTNHDGSLSSRVFAAVAGCAVGTRKKDSSLEYAMTAPAAGVAAPLLRRLRAHIVSLETDMQVQTELMEQYLANLHARLDTAREGRTALAHGPLQQRMRATSARLGSLLDSMSAHAPKSAKAWLDVRDTLAELLPQLTSWQLSVAKAQPGGSARASSAQTTRADAAQARKRWEPAHKIGGPDTESDSEAERPKSLLAMQAERAQQLARTAKRCASTGTQTDSRDVRHRATSPTPPEGLGTGSLLDASGLLASHASSQPPQSALAALMASGAYSRRSQGMVGVDLTASSQDQLHRSPARGTRRPPSAGSTGKRRGAQSSKQRSARHRRAQSLDFDLSLVPAPLSLRKARVVHAQILPGGDPSSPQPAPGSAGLGSSEWHAALEPQVRPEVDRTAAMSPSSSHASAASHQAPAMDAVPASKPTRDVIMAAARPTALPTSTAAKHNLPAPVEAVRAAPAMLPRSEPDGELRATTPARPASREFGAGPLTGVPVASDFMASLPTDLVEMAHRVHAHPPVTYAPGVDVYDAAAGPWQYEPDSEPDLGWLTGTVGEFIPAPPAGPRPQTAPPTAIDNAERSHVIGRRTLRRLGQASSEPHSPDLSMSLGPQRALGDATEQRVHTVAAMPGGALLEVQARPRTARPSSSRMRSDSPWRGRVQML